ncbi:MAG: bacteriochlorophyll 4-vinyl reductase [Eubacterium sp.]|nr:bacteriochlorophyll 4-vinyl reductase [Eubacterium sp.]
MTLENIIATAIQVPGVRVNREAFLREQFKDSPETLMQIIIEKGPVEAECPRDMLRKMANKIIQKKTLLSTGASFMAGLPGGLAMAATIPTDMLQFYGVALGMAQELSYLYGESDLWENGVLDRNKVTNQLILYCGVMLGASGAAQTVRVLSASLAKQALKKLPQKALTKTFYYPIVKSIAKVFGAKMTKEVFAKGVSKAVPIIGGVVSGGLTFASMKPMGKRLTDTLDKAHFEYEEEDFEADWKDIMAEYEKVEDEIVIEETEAIEADVLEENDTVAEFTEISNENDDESTESKNDFNAILEKIAQAKKLLDLGAISEDEFNFIKAKMIDKM